MVSERVMEPGSVEAAIVANDLGQFVCYLSVRADGVVCWRVWDRQASANSEGQSLEEAVLKWVECYRELGELAAAAEVVPSGRERIPGPRGCAGPGRIRRGVCGGS